MLVLCSDHGLAVNVPNLGPRLCCVPLVVRELAVRGMANPDPRPSENIHFFGRSLVLYSSSDGFPNNEHLLTVLFSHISSSVSVPP